MSAATSDLAYLLRWCAFLIRWVLCAGYSVLQFMGKPGSRVIVPAAMAAAVYAERSPLAAFASRYLLEGHWQSLPEPLTPGRVLVLGVLIAICVCATVAPHVFSIGWTISAAVGVFGFVVKTLVLAIFIGLGVVLYYNLPLDTGLLRYLPFGLAESLHTIDWRQFGQMSAPTTPLVIVTIGLVLASCVYVAWSRLLALLLGAFPPLVPPLRPMRKLRVKERVIRSVVVRFAVPKLPRRAYADSVNSLPVSNIPEG